MTILAVAAPALSISPASEKPAGAERGVARRRPPPEPDPELLRLLVARDREAFERLHALYAEFVHAVATRFDPSSAADVSQEVFLKLWQQIDRYQERARFSTWLFRVVANAALDSARHRRRRPEQTLEPTNELERGLAFEVPPAEPNDPIDRLDLAAAMAALSPKLRLPIVLRFYGGLDYDEIARALSLRPGTVASRIHRALERLSAHLDPPEGSSR